MNDQYQWLEKIDSPESQAWVAEKNKVSQDYFEKNKFYKSDKKIFEDILLSDDRLPELDMRNDWLYNVWKTRHHKQGLYRRIKISDYAKGLETWETILDLDQLSELEKINWIFSGAQYSKTSSKILLALSNGGSDAVAWREFDLEKKEFVVTNDFQLPESKSSLSWYDDNTVLVRDALSTGAKSNAGYARHIRIWKRGEKFAESKIIYSVPPGDMTVTTNFDFKSKDLRLYHYLDFTKIKVIKVDHLSEFSEFKVPLDSDGIHYFKDHYLLENKKDWNLGSNIIRAGSLVTWPAADINPTEKNIQILFTPNENEVLSQFFVSKNILYLGTLKNIQTSLYSFEVQNNRFVNTKLDLPSGGSIRPMANDLESDKTIWQQTDFLKVPQYVLTEPSRPQKIIKSIQPRFNQELFESHQHYVTSRDGTRVPYFIVHAKKMILNSQNPVRLSGYGGFELALLPNYVGAMGKVWLEQGGVYVVANIRGGGEFGPAWHQAAILEKKQRSYDDFIAVAEDLINRKITSKDKLAIEGGSNGGLLVGAVSMQRPDLFKVVLCEVPLLDMLRYHKLLAGSSWMAEYGNPDIPEQRAFIEKYSPYQNVKKGVKYPDFFFYTSTKDDRVHPGHARKMAAKLLGYNQSVLYFEQAEGGHSRHTALIEAADLYSKLTSVLKDKLGFK